MVRVQSRLPIKKGLGEILSPFSLPGRRRKSCVNPINEKRPALGECLTARLAVSQHPCIGRLSSVARAAIRKLHGCLQDYSNRSAINTDRSLSDYLWSHQDSLQRFRLERQVTHCAAIDRKLRNARFLTLFRSIIPPAGGDRQTLPISFNEESV